MPTNFFVINGENVPVPTADDLMFREAEVAERLYGGTLQQLAAEAEKGSMAALGVMLFLGYRRLHPDAKYSDFDFKISDLVDNSSTPQDEVAVVNPTEAVSS